MVFIGFNLFETGSYRIKTIGIEIKEGYIKKEPNPINGLG